MREAERVDEVFHWALVTIGIATIEDALELWADVPITERAEASARYLDYSLQMIGFWRRWAVQLALAHYRLTRALRTGATIAHPEKPETGPVSLEELRDEFLELIEQLEPIEIEREAGADEPSEAGEGDPLAEPENEPETGAERPDYDDLDYEDDDEILLEEIRELEDLIERQEREAEEEARKLLEELGLENLRRKLEDLAEDDLFEEVEAQRQEAHQQAGARQAAVAERITMNAARKLEYDLSEYDGRVIGWARYSTTGTPCGWCAMLISRGAVYKSARTAEYADGAKFHDNDHCVAIPLFLDEQFDGELFALNREYRALWDERIKGRYSGPDALTAWRRLFRQMQKEAQAVSTTQT